MILAELTISGTVHYISNEPAALVKWFAPRIFGFTPPQYNLRTDYGGYTQMSFGDITLSPALFASNWPPPKQCSIVIKHTETTLAAAVTLFSGYVYLDAFDRTSVEYSIYDTIYPKRLLSEGANEAGDTVPYPRAFGTVTHVTPLKLEDYNDGDGDKPTYHLGGVGTASAAVSIESFNYYSSTKTRITTESAPGWPDDTEVIIVGTVNFDGTYNIQYASGLTFVIEKAFPADNSEELPIHASAYVAGTFLVFDDGVPIQKNVVINTGAGAGTFSLTDSPVGEVTISGTASQTTLEEVMTWGQGQLDIGSIVTANARSTSPDINYWATSQTPLIDFLGEICSFFTHYFYIKSDILTFGDMLKNNGESSVTEWDYFKQAVYGVADVISQIKTSWTTRAPKVGFVDEVRTARFIEDTTNHMVESLYTTSSGTTTGEIENKLVDPEASFIDGGVKVGFVAQNTTDDTFAIVTVVAAEQLTLDSNIFVSGETYVVGPSMPYAKDMSVNVYHDARSNIKAALQNILEVLGKDTGTVKLPISSSLPVPGTELTFPDTSMVVDVSTYIRVRNLSFDFDNHEVIISGEGVIT